MTFTFTVTPADWGRIAPELILVVMTLILMLVDLVLPHEGEKRTKHSGPANFAILPVVALLGLAGALAATIVLFVSGDQHRAFNEMVGSDWGTLFAYLIILSASALGVLFSPPYLKRLNLVHQGEYYALLLFATVGMMLMAAATSFITVFLGLEMLSLALYILCSFVARRKASQESGMKYFLLSSFASAILLYGVALTYGATGSTSFIGVANFVNTTLAHSAAGARPILLIIAMGLLIVGFAFKISAVPFQAWTPDVYQGAPAPVTAFMSVGTKAAALIAFARVFGFIFDPARADWVPVVWAIAVLTIVGGNLMALVQSNVKRLLAYSSVAHAGYLLIGIVVGKTLGASAILFYLLCYTFLNLGAFGVVSMLEHVDNSGSNASDLRGLWYRRPLLAGLLAFFLLALAGFPPMAGFAAKYYLFYAALVGGHPELLIIGVLASVLGMYYYLRIIAGMFMEQAAAPAVATASAGGSGSAPASSARGSARTKASARTVSGGLATAVAVKPVSGKLAKVNEPATVEIEESQATGLNAFAWVGLALAALGTLAMGTVLPFWLVNLAQMAAQTMLK
ncbi:NADH-quinone oxidoreductase subunit N [Ktedonosporobacter rubrisoli]|uniref:NADH-quinone oxidoreductase subunit N n=1 Tax=Ktedonosporobacter rubrisoli TaxID=2509675 RepID=A0A4P6JXC4_KTERU|nr:NADH-quinone oxidoreductase subunit N [Ktedonosporobacter rubrisoli]QBD80175.1 NADH-quinone oxidoreductase subunit N [Ktedonosporobacter rubrisoli]